MQVLNSCNKQNFFINNTEKTSSVNNVFLGKMQGAKDFSNSDLFIKTNKSELRKAFEEEKSKQGLIGKAWDGIKNIFGMKAGSKNVEKIIKQAEKGEISQEEAQAAIKKYKDGQNMCVDVAADMLSGIIAIGAFALAVPTGGASLAAGLAIATAAGAGVKVGVKAGDAVLTGKEYTGKDLLHDSATGAINGIMAPVTNGIGASVTKTIGKKLGLKVIEEGAKEVAGQGIKQAAKSVILTQGIDVAGGTITKRAIALGTGMAVDGALSGAADNMVRAALNGEDIGKAGVQGAIGGAIAAPIIGGGFRVASKAGRALNNKITTKHILPDGLDTKFKQGETGDCAILSTIDGLMNNSETGELIKKSVTKTIFGDYNVKIGDTVVRVPKSALTDEMLSDKTGIRIFEQAYKQLQGNLDGGFAEVAAKQFGLNPVHITKDGITDELLDRLAKEQNNAVLSFGALVDSEGALSALEGQRHYFSIKGIDSKTKTVTVASTLDTSKPIKLSYDEVKSLGISIDGGTVKPTDLPNIPRQINEPLYKGIDVSRTKQELLDGIGISEEDANAILSRIHGEITADNIAANMELHNIKPEEITSFMNSLITEGNLSEDEAMFHLLQAIDFRHKFQESSMFSAFDISLKDTDEILRLVREGDISDIYLTLSEKNPDIAERLMDVEFFEKMRKQINSLIDESVLDVVTPDDIVSLGVINGSEKRVIFPNSTSVQMVSIPKGKESAVMQDLIKSNLVTTDLIEIVEEHGIKLPTSKTSKIPFNGSNIEIDYNPNEIIAQVRRDGFDSLTSHQIHALTDSFKDMYGGKKPNKEFQKLVDKAMSQNSKHFNEIYSYAMHLKKLAKKALPSGVEIEDHALMRMLDRNLITVTDNATMELLSFEQFIQLLAKNAKAGNDTISGYNGASGIKMLIKKDGQKVIIESVM